MLAKKYRLPVQSVLNQRNRTVRGRYFNIKIFPPTTPFVRVGVVVGAKVALKASARNKLKRAVYSETSKLLAYLKPGEYLIIAQKGAYEALSNDAILGELRQLPKQ